MKQVFAQSSQRIAASGELELFSFPHAGLKTHLGRIKR
jgi:hypothetical protein